MTKAAYWKADWFLGLVIALVLLFASRSTLIQGIERAAYDMGVRASERTPSPQVAVIAIDDQSIANIGRWPWPRELHARMLDVVASSPAKAVGYASFFFEPKVDPGLDYTGQLMHLFQALPPEIQHSLHDFGSVLSEAEEALNSDRKLAASVQRSANVALPMLFQLGEPRGNPDEPLPAPILKSQLPKVSDRIGAADTQLYPLPAIAASYPLSNIAAGAAAIGHLNAAPDVDGITRTEPLVVRYYDQYFPSISMMLAGMSLNLGAQDIEIRLGEGVRLGKLAIGTDPYLQMYTYFYQGRDGSPAFQVNSFYDVISGKIPAEKYRDKIVLIGATAAGVGTYQVTPISAAMPPVLTLAHSVSSILQEDFFIAPTWGRWVEIGVFLVIALYLVVLLPRLGAGAAAAMTALLFLALIGTHSLLMTSELIWLQLMAPVTLLAVGHLGLVTKRFIVTERGKTKSDLESAESDRMLGLAFQGQGELDMAFDKMKKVPLDDQVMDNLYNLTLDFERKRQFNKAQAVYDYMATHNEKFRDLEQKRDRAKHLSDSVRLGSGAAKASASTLVLDNATVEKPMLGRYQLEKEIGKGAMGVVYYGRDPKIGRVVAIKTLALSEEFEPDGLEEVKQRFFREAETAGRLNQPNIVTIYVAGEEHDLAYIPKEVLNGQDLAAQSKPENRFPLPKVLSIIGRVADASLMRTLKTFFTAISSRRTSCGTRLLILSRSPTSVFPHYRFIQNQDRDHPWHALVHVA